MKASEVRELTDEELLSREQELRDTLFHLRLQKATGDLINTAQLSLIRKDLARVLGLIREKNLKQSRTPRKKK
jgi:large subunit ribosomal protein L29